MSHEPECLCAQDSNLGLSFCACDILRAAYRRGFNDHATAAQHWRDTHGAYQQHGAGENP